MIRLSSEFASFEAGFTFRVFSGFVSDGHSLWQLLMTLRDTRRHLKRAGTNAQPATRSFSKQTVGGNADLMPGRHDRNDNPIAEDLVKLEAVGY
jgi:hypothetical protein